VVGRNIGRALLIIIVGGFVLTTLVTQRVPQASAPFTPKVTIVPSAIARATLAPTQSSNLVTVKLSNTPIPSKPTSTPNTSQSTHSSYFSLPVSVKLDGVRHQQQTWNNCGPANISMLLQYFGRSETQRDAAQFLKPARDDKNVSPSEMVAYAQSLGFKSRVIHGSDIQLLKTFVANGLPVIAETWFIPTPNDEMGHYKLLLGYDSNTLIYEDSYKGPDTKLDATEFDSLWKVFNRAMIVVWRDDQEALAQSILGERANEKRMFELALGIAQKEIDANPNDKFAWFNLGTNQLALGNSAAAVKSFDKADSLKLPWRMLWYQFGPFEANYAEGNYDSVIRLTTRALKTTGDLEESYYWRGRAFLALGKKFDAKRDFSIALKLNPNFELVKQALKDI
jgi:tetratricopeptide (TPR) repeat protein